MLRVSLDSWVYITNPSNTYKKLDNHHQKQGQQTDQGAYISYIPKSMWISHPSPAPHTLIRKLLENLVKTKFQTLKLGPLCPLCSGIGVGLEILLDICGCGLPLVLGFVFFCPKVNDFEDTLEMRRRLRMGLKWHWLVEITVK